MFTKTIKNMKTNVSIKKVNMVVIHFRICASLRRNTYLAAAYLRTTEKKKKILFTSYTSKDIKK